MDFQEQLGRFWEKSKPVLQGLIIGLIAGPIITLYMGWMITSSSMGDRVHAALVDEEASICAARAKAAKQGAATLEWSERTKLAAKFAVMPGEKAGSDDYEVTNACADKIAAPSEHKSS